MPILSPIQRRAPGGRLLVAGMYVLLVVGSVWMVYPFLLMLSGSVKSEVDIRHFDIFPEYLYNDLTLFRKFEAQRYGQLDMFTAATRYHDAQARPLYSFEFLPAPAPVAAAALRDWNDFMATIRSWPRHFLQFGHTFGYRTVPEMELEYRHRLWKAFPEVPRQEIISALRIEAWQTRTYQTVQGPYAPVYQELRQTASLRYFIPMSVDGHFILTQLQPIYGSGTNAVTKLNAKWGTQYPSIYDVTMSRTPPAHPAQVKDWWEFVQKSLSVRFVKFAPSLRPAYHDFLKAKYQTIEALNKVYGGSIPGWDEIEFPTAESAIAAFSDLEGFLQTRASPDGVSLDSPDFRWRQFLREKYDNNLEALNQAHQAAHGSFDDATMPLLAHDWNILQQNKKGIIREYITRNYRIVWDYLSGQGNAFRNTILFCVLNVLTALIVNPLAAYALSRFQPRWGYKALFLLMATMAFPGEVTQIPSFLMLREMGMLNTFAALIIPAAANGYSIFLLKGFFDSLPKDLYESATLDGASELRVFTTITIPLSAPILAVIALGAFTAAYGAFMFALLVCQKESMWTLMVYIYQLQQFYGTPIVFASLVLAAVPTLLVFVFCQNIIMRGIVVPVEK
ncbi:MAG: ABC transporter permease subunit [Verrucomicrobia bacterium]|nr:ABC transporter permease subunit [Verrucomicrobiota bacterium]